MTREGTAAEAFSATAERYEKSIAPALAPVGREVVRRALLRPGERVLDVGTGTGTAAAMAAGNGRSVVGIDAAAGMLEIARAAHPELKFVEADFAALPFADGSFDVVIGVHSIQFADDPVAVMAELRRVTRRGGRLSLSAPGPIDLTPPGVHRDVYDRFGLEVPPNGTTEDELRAWAREAGWTDVTTDTDPSFRLRLNGEEGVRHWLATGPRGKTSAGWDHERTDAFVAALIDAAEQDGAGNVLLRFGALYVMARRPEGD